MGNCPICVDRQNDKQLIEEINQKSISQKEHEMQQQYIEWHQKNKRDYKNNYEFSKFDIQNQSQDWTGDLTKASDQISYQQQSAINTSNVKGSLSFIDNQSSSFPAFSNINTVNHVNQTDEYLQYPGQYAVKGGNGGKNEYFEFVQTDSKIHLDGEDYVFDFNSMDIINNISIIQNNIVVDDTNNDVIEPELIQSAVVFNDDIMNVVEVDEMGNEIPDQDDAHPIINQSTEDQLNGEDEKMKSMRIEIAELVNQVYDQAIEDEDMDQKKTETKYEWYQNIRLNKRKSHNMSIGNLSTPTKESEGDSKKWLNISKDQSIDKSINDNLNSDSKLNRTASSSDVYSGFISSVPKHKKQNKSKDNGAKALSFIET